MPVDSSRRFNLPGIHATLATRPCAHVDLGVDRDTVNGLGLRIVQLIARMHDAQLTLRNKTEGGEEVTLTLKAYVDLG